MATDKPMQLGMIGLGRMGANLSRRLMNDGHHVVVYDVNADAVKSLAADGRLDALGIEPAAESPDAFAQFIRADYERSAALLKAANFHPQ